MPFAADSDIWRFQTHPEVWLIVAVIVGFGYWVTHVLGPKAVPEGQPIVTKRQTMAFVGAVILLWLSSDWPVHDISEEYLYSVHMAQHLLISLVVPPLFLLATPEWLARLIVSEDGSTGVWVRRLTRPVTAAVLFNVVVALTHLTWVVNTSIDSSGSSTEKRTLAPTLRPSQLRCIVRTFSGQPGSSSSSSSSSWA